MMTCVSVVSRGSAAGRMLTSQPVCSHDSTLSECHKNGVQCKPMQIS